LSKQAQVAGKAYDRERHYKRHRFDVAIQAAVFRHGETINCWGRTTEVSLDGIGANLSGELQVGEVVSLEFSIPIAPGSMTLRAVVRSSEGRRCGFEFLVVTDDQKRILRQVCGDLAAGR
jgi:hypothetical protein